MTQSKISIDLNADLGEHPGSSLDEQLMPYLSSCNVACGGHIGDEASVRTTVRLAKEYGVAVGAHPSYPDTIHFGREIMDITNEELMDSLKAQIQLVHEVCRTEGVRMHHVKPHGALYNHAASNQQMSLLMYDVLTSLDKRVYWMGLANSLSEEVANTYGYPFIAEGFADRRYEVDGTLRSRSLEGALLAGKEVIGQVDSLVFEKRVLADHWVSLDVQSICLHGDTPDAVTLAKEIHTHLVNRDVHITAV